MNFDASLLLSDGTPLTPCDAAVAIIVVKGRYLMQERDCREGIFFPGHMGFFGGGIESDETPLTALVRELEEELGLTFTSHEFSFFTKLTFDFSFASGRKKIARDFYVLSLCEELLGRIRVREGRGFALLSPLEALNPALSVAPYDAVVLWMHVNRKGFVFDDGN